MEWDDSGMNITVNPLEEVDKSGVDLSDEESSDGGERWFDLFLGVNMAEIE